MTVEVPGVMTAPVLTLDGVGKHYPVYVHWNDVHAARVAW